MTDDYEVGRVEVGGGVVAVLVFDPSPWDGIDPVDDTDHPGTLYAWHAGRDVGPHDGASMVGRVGPDGTRRAWYDAAGYVRSDDPDGWARETAAEIAAAGGVVVPVRFDDYGSSGARFGTVDTIDDASGLFVIDGPTVAKEWPVPVPGDASSYAQHWHEDGLRSSRDAAYAYADAFIREVGAWVAGEVYGYLVRTVSGETLDAGYGYIGANPERADDWCRAEAVGEAEWWRDVIAYHRAVLAAAVEGPDLAAALRAVADLAVLDDETTDPDAVAA